jgi:ferredoxin-type protein NapG
VSLLKSTRREFLGLMGFTLGSAALFTTAGKIPEPKPIIRPPGAVNEASFLATCLRCQQCINVCPEKALKPAAITDGFLVGGTPVLFHNCTICLDCIKVCPSGALDKNTTMETAKMAIAEVIEDECIGCDKCIPACQFEAITPLPEEKLVKVDYDKCKGCFMCVTACPVEPKGIRVVPL